MRLPVRILHVLGRLDRGGAETMIMDLYRNVDRSKIQFDFVIHTNDTCEYSEEIYELGGKIYNVPRYNGKNHIKYKKAWNLLFSQHPEYKIVHGHVRSTASIYLNIAKKYGLITIAHSHSIASRGNKVEQLVKNTLQLPIRYIADYMFACSEDAGEWLFGKRVKNNRNFYIIKNAIDIKEFTFDKCIRKKVRDLYTLNGRFVIGHVGNFTAPKNHMFLLEVFFIVQKSNENTTLILIGDGELREQIKNRAKILGINEKVIIAGSKDNVNEFLQSMDLFLFPSLFEGLGMAVVEAQAAGLPCIISDNVPDAVMLTELVEKKTLNSPQKWANAILNMSKIERKTPGNVLKEHGYDIKLQAKQLEEKYVKILNTKSNI